MTTKKRTTTQAGKRDDAAELARHISEIYGNTDPPGWFV